MKFKQPHLGFELKLPCPFPMMITVPLIVNLTEFMNNEGIILSLFTWSDFFLSALWHVEYFVFVFQVDDAKDETVSLILDDFTAPNGFEICNTETLPGVTNIVCNLQVRILCLSLYVVAFICVHSLIWSTDFNIIIHIHLTLLLPKH